MEANSNTLPPVRRPRMVDRWYVGDERFPADPIGRLAYYAHLAPSSRNSQPWRFVVGPSEIDVFADFDRRLQAADADGREMHVSLGCAIESVRIAADFGGFGTQVSYFPLAEDDTLVARISVALGGPKRQMAAADLLEPMMSRHTSHRVFDPSRPVSEQDKKRLYRCFEIGGVSLEFMQERAVVDTLASIETRADAALLSRPDYRAELARSVGEGFLGKSWLLSKLSRLGLVPLAGRVAREDAERVASAPLLALLTTRHDRRLDQIQAGEAFMRIALIAERCDIRVQPISQVLEVAETRAQLAKLFGLGERVAQHLFRLGHAQPDDHPAPRRPLDSVLVRAG